MESEFEPIRGALGKRLKRTAPADLADKVMGEVLRMEQRRVYRRLVIVMTLRSAVFVAVLLLLLLPLVSGFGSGSGSGGIRIDFGLRALEGLESGGRWMLNNFYFLLPLMVLLFVRRLFAIK